jgi:two-component system chemotaxis sensor kinase CheA
MQVAVQLDTQSISAKGFAGVALVQDHATAFVDIYQVIELAYPAWFKRGQAARVRAGGAEGATVLLAEDSGFYRTVEKNYLVQEGFNVLDVADGVQALDVLKREPVQLVVTDIEMPNMDGFELTRQIRATREWRDLPVIAVTSLANDADREAGLKAGVNAYLVKLEREALIQEAMRLLSLTARGQAQKVS